MTDPIKDKWESLENMMAKAKEGRLDLDDLTDAETRIIQEEAPSENVQNLYGAAFEAYNVKFLDKNQMAEGPMKDILESAMYEIVAEEYAHNDLLIKPLLQAYQEIHTTEE